MPAEPRPWKVPLRRGPRLDVVCIETLGIFETAFGIESAQRDKMEGRNGEGGGRASGSASWRDADARLADGGVKGEHGGPSGKGRQASEKGNRTSMARRESLESAEDFRVSTGLMGLRQR